MNKGSAKPFFCYKILYLSIKKSLRNSDFFITLGNPTKARFNIHFRNLKASYFIPLFICSLDKVFRGYSLILYYLDFLVIQQFSFSFHLSYERWYCKAIPQLFDFYFLVFYFINTSKCI